MLPIHDENPTARFPVVTIALIAINALIFLYQASLSEQEFARFVVQWGFIPQRLNELGEDTEVQIQIASFLREDSGSIRLTTEPGSVLPTIFTCMFLHGSWMHLIGNMWFLWLFGNNIEDRVGYVRYIVFYLLAGLAATLVHYAIDMDSAIPTIGASGAISGVLGGYAVLWPMARVRCMVPTGRAAAIVHVPAILIIGLFFVRDLLTGLASLSEIGVNGGVAVWAHVGGMVAGALMIYPFMLGIAVPRTMTNDGREIAPWGRRDGRF
jgi:membrane associated rhomboid family serine protease